jgi:O-antigen/teichoic acid export membrane protein
MPQNVEISGELLTKNWGLNILGLVLPMCVALAAFPYLVRSLGPERFGILSLVWIILGNYVVFDIGLGRATIKFTAECLGRGDMEKLPRVVWTSVWLQTMLGLAGSALMAVVVPIVVDRLLRIPAALVQDAKLSFFILAASLPLLLMSAAVRGVLEAGQHFAEVNAIKAPLSASLFLLPALGVALRLSLPWIVLLLVAARLIALICWFIFCLRFYPVLRHYGSVDWKILRPLVSFGGWVTVTNVAAPLLTQIDRFFIGSMLPLSALGYYAAPYEAISRIWVIPGSLVSTLFPAFTSLEAMASKKRIQDLCIRSLKSLLLILAPILSLIIFLAHDILRVFLGEEFASHGTLVLQILALGVLVNSLGLIPFSLLQGLGRPDITAKLSLLELPLYIIALWFLVKYMGLAGAAIAFTLRCAVDTFLLFGALAWLDSVGIRSFQDSGLRRSLAAIALFAAALPAVWTASSSLLPRTLMAVALILLFGWAAWSYVLDGRERGLVLATAIQFRNTISRTS